MMEQKYLKFYQVQLTLQEQHQIYPPFCKLLAHPQLLPKNVSWDPGVWDIVLSSHSYLLVLSTAMIQFPSVILSLSLNDTQVEL